MTAGMGTERALSAENSFSHFRQKQPIRDFFLKPRLVIGSEHSLCLPWKAFYLLLLGLYSNSESCLQEIGHSFPLHNFRECAAKFNVSWTNLPTQVPPDRSHVSFLCGSRVLQRSSQIHIMFPSSKFGALI